VFFDNLQVRHDRGRIIEENHYYAHGLKIAAISSKAYSAPNNNYGYQGDFSEMDDDLGWNDFELRSYDPQIGRFLQNDPYDQFASGYVGMGNDPVNNIDPSGGWAATGIFDGLSQAGIIGVTTLAGAIIGGAIDLASGGDGLNGMMIGASAGFLSNYLGLTAINAGVKDGKISSDYLTQNRMLHGPNIGNGYFQTNLNWEICVNGTAYDYFGYNETTSKAQVGIGEMKIIDLDNSEVLGIYQIVSGPGDRGVMPDSPEGGYDYDGGIEETPANAPNRGAYETDDGFSFKVRYKRAYLIGNRTSVWIHPTKTLKRPKKMGVDKNTGDDVFMIGTTDGCIGIIGKSNAYDFYKKMKQYYKVKKSIKVKVKFDQNKNRKK